MPLHTRFSQDRQQQVWLVSPRFLYLRTGRLDCKANHYDIIMKKFLCIAGAFVLCASACLAGQTTVASHTTGYTELAASDIYVPTGLYANGSNWVRVYKDSVSIVINGNRRDYSFKAERGLQGSVLLKFDGECITIYPDGSLYYDGKEYIKKA